MGNYNINLLAQLIFKVFMQVRRPQIPQLFTIFQLSIIECRYINSIFVNQIKYMYIGEKP